MYVSQITLSNFRSCRATTVTLQPDLTVLAGENNAGKSTVVDTLRTLTTPLDNGGALWPTDNDVATGETQLRMSLTLADIACVVVGVTAWTSPASPNRSRPTTAVIAATPSTIVARIRPRRDRFRPLISPTFTCAILAPLGLNPQPNSQLQYVSWGVRIRQGSDRGRRKHDRGDCLCEYLTASAVFVDRGDHAARARDGGHERGSDHLRVRRCYGGSSRSSQSRRNPR